MRLPFFPGGWFQIFLDFFTSTWENDPISPGVGGTTQLVFLWCCLVQAFKQLKMCLRFCAKAIYDMWAMWGNASWSMLNSFVFFFQILVNPRKTNCWTKHTLLKTGLPVLVPNNQNHIITVPAKALKIVCPTRKFIFQPGAMLVSGRVEKQQHLTHLTVSDVAQPRDLDATVEWCSKTQAIWGDFFVWEGYHSW